MKWDPPSIGHNIQMIHTEPRLPTESRRNLLLLLFFLGLVQKNKRRGAPQVSHKFTVRTSLRRLKQTRFCWPFNNWQVTVTQPISKTILTESQNCQNLSRRQWPLRWEFKKTELFEDLFQTSLKNDNEFAEDDKIKFSTFSCAGMRWRVQKHQKPKQGESDKTFDCVPYKIRRTPFNGYGETRIPAFSVLSSKPEII